MAKFLSRSLTLIKSSVEFPRRFKSTRAIRAQLIEIDVDSSSDSVDVEVLGIRRLEDAIHNIIVQRSAPSWLVFRPGSSYWVPSKPTSSNIAKLVQKLSNPLTDEETLAFTSACGWPSSSYFLNGNGFPEPIIKDAEGTMHAHREDIKSKSEDEE